MRMLDLPAVAPGPNLALTSGHDLFRIQLYCQLRFLIVVLQFFIKFRIDSFRSLFKKSGVPVN